MNLYHSVPEFLIIGQNFNVTVVCSGTDSDISLVCTAAGRDSRVSMTRTSTYADNDRQLNVYTAVISADTFATSDKLDYHFECGGEHSGEYSVAVSSAGHMPPLAVTELYARPKGKNMTFFIEVMNPSSVPTDLYNYKFMAYAGAEPVAEDYICSLYLSEVPGAEIINPGEVAALWPLLPNHHAAGDNKYLTREGFIEVAMEDFPKPAFDLTKTDFRLIPVEASRFDEATSKYVPLDGMNRFPVKTETTTLVLTPREALPENGLEKSVYSMVYNLSEYGDRDTPVRHSSLWTIDVRRPERGVNVSHRALMTPGVLDRGQAIPVVSREYAALIPLDADITINAQGTQTPLRFAVEGGYAADAYIVLKLSGGKSRRFNACSEGDGRWCVMLPQDAIFDLKRLCYTIHVYDGIRHIVLGSAAHPLVTRLRDLRGPFITRLMPERGYCYDDTRTPEICVRFGDASGVNLTASVMCVDKKNVTSLARWEAGCVTYTPSKPLRYGEHSYEVMLQDNEGNKTYRRVEFSVGRPDELNLYHGEIHAHTAFSDGIATPEEAMAYARDVGGADFFALTEHSHYIDDELYRRQIAIADKYEDPGHFAALFGFEMTWNNTCALWGHMNVLGSRWYEYDIRGKGIPELYDRLCRDRDAVAMFNHPGLPWGNFHDYDNYSPEADRAVCLSEIKGAGYDHEYSNLLTRGWHASPTFSEDNHNYNWTTATPSTTYVLAPALTRDNIMDAFRRRRTYSTGDSTMKIRFKINGHWMGSRITAQGMLRVEAEISTECESGIGNIALMGEDNIVVASVNAGALKSYRLRLSVAPEFDYYYLRITSAGKYTVTAPVWIENTSPLTLCSLEHCRGGEEYRPHTVTAKFKNASESCARDIKVDFYLTPVGGFDLERTVPYRTVTIPLLPEGSTAKVSCDFPDVVGMRRLSAVVRGMIGRRRYTDTGFVVLSPLAVTEILTASSDTVDHAGKTVKNPFMYFQLYNMSGRDICLNGHTARLWVTTGKQPVEEHMLHFDGQTVKAGGVLTVWGRPAGAELDAEDFDRRYGVMMSEGEELMITEVPVLDASGDARRLDIMCDKEMLTRCEFDFRQFPGTDLHTDRAMTFDPSPTMTGKQTMTSNNAVPSPGAYRQE